MLLWYEGIFLEKVVVIMLIKNIEYVYDYIYNGCIFNKMLFFFIMEV